MKTVLDRSRVCAFARTKLASPRYRRIGGSRHAARVTATADPGHLPNMRSTKLRYSTSDTASSDAVGKTKTGSGRNLVVAVDETKESEVAFKWTLENIHRDGDLVHLLHVVPYVHRNVVPTAVYYSPPLDPELQKQMADQAEAEITERFKPILEDAGISCEVDLVQERDHETIGEAVCDAALNLKASLVVVAAHKKHWLASWLLGSSSGEVAAKAPVPVVVFHG